MTPKCPHGHGEMVHPINGELLETDEYYCPECFHEDRRLGHVPCNICQSRLDRFEDSVLSDAKDKLQKLTRYIYR